MDADDARQKIIELTDRWARDVMRSDRSMNPVEQALLEAVMNYRRIVRSTLKIPKKVDKLPPPPPIPRDLGQEIATELDTLRYSEIPTIPTPPCGIEAMGKCEVDIESLEYIDDVNEFELESTRPINSRMPTKRASKEEGKK